MPQDSREIYSNFLLNLCCCMAECVQHSVSHTGLTGEEEFVDAILWASSDIEEIRATVTKLVY